jgi:hypothetical protein
LPASGYGEQPGDVDLSTQHESNAALRDWQAGDR